MSLDHIALIVSASLLVLLLGLLFAFRLVKSSLINKNRDAYERVHALGNKFDKIHLPFVLLVLSGLAFLLWLVVRVLMSYGFVLIGAVS